MKKGELRIGGSLVSYVFDTTQDALYITFSDQANPSYYDETDDIDLMIRRDSQTDVVVGITVRNVNHRVGEEEAIRWIEDEVRRECILFREAA